MSSLYAIEAGVVLRQHFVNLSDHPRSHADVIE
jgi:hypothetical protein